MHVVIVTRIYAPESAAAAYRLAALADSLVAGGHDVTVLTSTAPSSVSGTDRPGTAREHARIRIRRWPVKRNRDGQVRGYLSYMSFDAPALVRLLALRRVDLVISEPPPTTGFVVTLAAALKRVPHIHYAADCWSDATAAAGAPVAVVRFVRYLESATLRRAAHVVTVNESIAARLAELNPTARITVVGNGVDTQVFRADGPTRVQPRPYVVYAGTTSEWQGAGVLIDAWARVVEVHPDVDLVFIGGGTEWESLHARARAASLAHRVSFIPTVPALEAAAWLRSARASVVSLRPGLGYDYALPTKVLASLASGTPVVFSGEGVTRQWLAAMPTEIAGGSSGVGAAAVDVAAALIALLNSPPTAASRGRLAGWAAAVVSLSAVADRVLAVVDRIGARGSR